MTTEARILANRLNAQKSTGFKSPHGKAVVSQNALKHGLSASRDIITSESQPDFDLHHDALLADLDPQGPMESFLAGRIVSLSWRLKRADLIQNQTFDAMNEKNTNNPLADLAKSFGLKGLSLPQNETSDSHSDLTLGRIALKDFSNARVLDRLLMYERRIEHSLYKTILELQRLRLLRNLDLPVPHSQHNLAPGFTGGPPQKSPENQASATPLFSRRRHDDALTPNSPSTKQNPPAPWGTSDIQRTPAPWGKCAKQTQFPKPQNQHNPCLRKELQPKTTPTTPQETNPIKPNSSPKLEPCSTLSEVEGPIQTQFPRPQHDIRYPTSDIQTSKDPHISHLQSRPRSIILLQPEPGKVYETRTTDNQLQTV